MNRDLDSAREDNARDRASPPPPAPGRCTLTGRIPARPRSAHSTDSVVDDEISSSSAAETPVLIAHELPRVAALGGAAFTESEHRDIGDDATGKQMVELAPDFHVTYGEMVAMAGDHFGSLAEIRALAAHPGHGVGTREEVDYVLTIEIRKNKAEEGRFSKEVKKAAGKRYYGLAAHNQSHFLNPREGDTELGAADKASLPTGSGSAYRTGHTHAIEEAWRAGRTRADIATALAAEAFSNHFLTDSFSAGHVRTPRESISEYWDPKVPGFFDKFKGLMATRIADHLIRYNFWPAVGGPLYVYNKTLETLNERLEANGMAAVTFGDLVSGAVHDYDNLHGVEVEIAGSRETLYGDGNMRKEGGNTERVAVIAVRRSVHEVEEAYQLGRQGKALPDVFIALTGEDGLYGAEQLLPKVLPDDEQLVSARQSIPWRKDSPQALLADPRFREAVKVFLTAKREQLAEIGAGLDEPYKRTAFSKEIVDHMHGEQGIKMLEDVLVWTPGVRL